MKQSNQYTFKIQNKHPLHFFYAVDKESFKPDITSMASVYPNPVSTTVTFPIFIANTNESVRIEIYDGLGKIIKSIANASYGSGLHMEHWDCSDEQGSRVSSGMYVYRFVGRNNLVQTGKLIVK
jgi:flagellar hook assembly protein FlgD